MIERAGRAASRGTGVTRLDDPAQTGLAGLIDPVSGRDWAQAALSGVLASGEASELLATLRAWLGNHGQIDATGVALGVHRHTVRHRLRRAESLLAISLDEASVRAELWFALENLDHRLLGPK
jgi:purine catabolism regulator